MEPKNAAREICKAKYFYQVIGIQYYFPWGWTVENLEQGAVLSDNF